MLYLQLYLLVGFLFVVVSAARGLYSVQRHVVTILGRDGARETKETREVTELVVTLVLTVVAWPMFPAYWLFQLVMDPILRRRFDRDHPTWLGR